MKMVLHGLLMRMAGFKIIYFYAIFLKKLKLQKNVDIGHLLWYNINCEFEQ